jgi:hypothetical protein
MFEPNIIRSEGNLVYELDNFNATQVLLTAMESAGLVHVKNDEFYLAIIEGDDSQVPNVPCKWSILVLICLLGISSAPHYFWRSIKRVDFFELSSSTH